LSKVLTVEKALSILHAHRCWCAHEEFTDENGAATLLLVKPRTLGAWRKQGKGPAWAETSRVVYEVSAVVDYFNSTGSKNSKPQGAASGT
jgi:hypothetical protein